MNRFLTVIDLYVLRLLPGKMVHKFRLGVLRKLGAKLAGDVVIGRGTTILGPSYLRIDKGASIARDSVLDARGGLEIGENALIGFETVILTSTHNFQSKSIPIVQQGMYVLSSKVGSNVWIGARSFLMPGVEIGDDTIVGAMSLVNKNLECASIFAGVPAKKIRDR